jgi:hypothetical protein
VNDFQREHGPFASPKPSWWPGGPRVLVTAGVQDRLFLVGDSWDADWLAAVVAHIDTQKTVRQAAASRLRKLERRENQLTP